jgi:hypothetical protein
MGNIILSLVVLAVAICFQIVAFSRTQHLRHTLRQIFPDKPEEDLSTEFDEWNTSVQITYANEKKKSSIFTEIVEAINNYLRKNQGASDYSTLKDITDRQCDAVEAQIDTTAPVPIYIGLCGTLVGIVLGVGVLGYGGGIDSLLEDPVAEETITVNTKSELPSISAADVGQKVAVKSTGDTFILTESRVWELYEDAGAVGIRDLLRGVAIAMLTTFFGVLFTIIGSTSYRASTKENERKKNRFLNWMQGELLPQMKHNMASTLTILQQNLTKFNKDFAANSKNLNDIFKNINTTYQENTKLLEAVQKLDVDAMAEANVRVLKELRLCTEQINDLHSFLELSNKYLTNVEALNGNLSDHLDRTKLIENLGTFFKDEVLQIQVRKEAIAKAVGDIDLEVQKSLEGLSKHTGQQYEALTTATSTQHLEFMKAIEAQQKALNKKLEETSLLVEEMKNLKDVKESMGRVADATIEQNEKLNHLLKLEESIRDLANTSSSQGGKIDRLADAVRQLVENGIPAQTNGVMQIPVVTRRARMPLWAIITGCFTCVVVIGTCVVFVIKAFGVL